MADQVTRLFEKYNIQIEDILYITRNNGRSYIQLLSGKCVDTCAPVKTVTGHLPMENFWNIQKGVLVQKRHVMNIDKDYIYTMVDGKQFEGKHRTPGEHKLHRLEIEGVIRSAMAEAKELPLSFLEKCSIMEDAPIAFCVVEFVFSEEGHGIDFVFRYCNKEMEVLEGVPVEQMVNRSFYEVFPHGDKKWVIPYAEVALNGKKRILQDYSPEIDKNITVRCYQPEQGYCACILTVE